MKYVGVKFRDTKFDTERLGPKVYVYKTNLEIESMRELGELERLFGDTI